nr:beta-ketoacyl-ACP synthase III [uncultured Dethiosulfovibrio sp.]
MSLIVGRPVQVVSTGMAVPSKTLDNHQLSKVVDTTDQWIVERTGIKLRHIASEGENASDLASCACRHALEKAGVSADTVDMIVVATNSPDTLFPAVSCRVQGIIGAVNSGAMDVQSGCNGSISAMSVGASGIASGLWNRVLVVGVEVLSRLIDWSDRSTCILFGDGAGAVLLEAGSKKGMLSCDLRADGTLCDYITLPAGLSALPASDETVREKKHFVSMKGNEVFKFTQRVLPGYLSEVCAKVGLAPEDIDWWVFHQANMRIVEGVLRRLKVDRSKSIDNLDRYGNTSAASVFIALDEGYKDGRIVSGKGQKVLVTSFGAGMTYGAFVFES